MKLPDVEKHDDLTCEYKKIEKEWLLLKIQVAEAALQQKGQKKGKK